MESSSDPVCLYVRYDLIVSLQTLEAQFSGGSPNSPLPLFLCTGGYFLLQSSMRLAAHLVTLLVQ